VGLLRLTPFGETREASLFLHIVYPLLSCGGFVRSLATEIRPLPGLRPRELCDLPVCWPLLSCLLPPIA